MKSRNASLCQEFSIEMSAIHTENFESIHPSASSQDPLSISRSQQRENDIRTLCKSRMYSSWEDEYHNILEDYKTIDAIELVFPNFYRGVNIFFSYRAYRLSVLINLWNIAGFVVFGIKCPSYVGVNGVLYYIELILPFILLLIHGTLLRLWKGKLSEESTRSELTESVEFRQHLSLMIHYLNNSSEELNFHSPIVVRKETKFYYKFCQIYLAILFSFYLLYVVINANSFNSGYNDACVLFNAYTRALSLPIFSVIAVSGLAIFFGICTLNLTTIICHNMIGSWLNRYFSIKRVSLRSLEDYIDRSLIPSTSCSAKEFGRKIRRDSLERYFFVHFFVKETAKAWDLLISCIILFGMLIAAFFLYFSIIQFVNNGNIIYEIVFFALFTLSITSILFILMRLTYTNAAVLQIRKLLEVGVPESSIYKALETDSSPIMDYEILGGKDEVLAYTNDKPIYWEVYGFAVTPAVLKSVFLGSFTTIAGASITYLSTLLQ